jgi:hypothetical protein
LMELTLFDFRSLGLLTNTKQSITHKQSRDPPFSLATIRPLKPFQSNIPQTNPTLCATNPPSLSSYHLTFLLSRSTFHSDWTLVITFPYRKAITTAGRHPSSLARSSS